MKVSDDFDRKIKELQKKIRMTKGEEMSLVKITDRIVKDVDFAILENKLLGDDMFNINIKLERRKK